MTDERGRAAILPAIDRAGDVRAAVAKALRTAGLTLDALALLSDVVRTAGRTTTRRWLDASCMAASLCVGLGRHDEALERSTPIVALDAALRPRLARARALFHSTWC